MNPRERWHQKAKEEKPDRRNDTPKDDPIDKSRRELLGLSVAAGAVGAGGILLRALNSVTPPENKAPAEDVTYREKLEPPEFLTLEKNPRPYDTSQLAGEKFGYPLNMYFGMFKQFGPTTNVDFRYQLAWMWAMKATDMGIWKRDLDPKLPLIERIRTAASKHRDDANVRMMNDIVMSYDPDSARQMNAAEYYLDIQEALRQAREAIDWGRIKPYFHLSNAQSDFFRAAERYLDPQTLFAFNITELMPELSRQRHKITSLDVFEVALRTGGYEFLARVPSGGDLKISYGTGQLTKRLFQKGKDKGSLTIMRGILKKKDLLPEHIGELSGMQHHIASYLNGVFSLALLAQSLDATSANALAREPIGDDIRLFVSGAHNSPKAAIKSFKGFANSYIDAKKQQGRPRPSFATFTEPLIQEYVNRADGNLKDVRARGGTAYVQN